ncbi:hypothetical protein UlMin_007808 [Ulmus minor]
MTDGRRHSVDIPISKALVALRRVRSLRDPSTISTSKFSSLADNVNWETNSNNGISLRFSDSYHEGSYSKNRASRKNAGYYGEMEDYIDDFSLNCALGKSKLNLYENSGRGGSKSTAPKGLQGEILRHRASFEEENYRKNSLSERYGSNHITKNDIIPSINPLVDVDSCNELDVRSLEGKRRDHIISKRNFDCTIQEELFEEGDGTSRLCSPTLSDRDVFSRHSLALFAREEVDVVDDIDNGCGISCWSGTPRFRGTNLSTDVEDHPLLHKNVEEHEIFEKRSLKHIGNEIIPYFETPRSLSQKFRPKSFSELVGQNVVARSLLGAIFKARVTSFYLFHGPRGTGKTSASRIFAAALNCLSLEENGPCGICRECLLFFSGRSRDVKEVDSVRINRRDRVRSLVKNALSHPVSSRFKVFIVDECHLLHGETWSTLLNSLDKLSQHVIFVMITSELDKIPRNAVSRSQRYHFPKIKDADISSRLVKICREEGLDFDQAALEFIAAKSSGSLRDAEMMLDQLSLLSKKITMSLAYELIGIVSDDELLELLDLALSADTSKTVRRARELMRSRIDPMQLISQLANLIMDILAGKCEEGCSNVKSRFSSGHTSEADLQKLSRALKVLSETEKQLRVSKNQTTWLTVALLQLSSMEYSSLEGNDSKLWLENALDSGERGSNLISSFEDGEIHRSETCKDCRRTLKSIWQRATALCQSNSLENFLKEQGKLSSLFVSQGLAVAELEFCHPDSVTKAEKSWKLIVNSLKSILGCNVEIRINLVPFASNSRYAKVKKPSFSLFSCSRRTQKSQSSERGSNSDYSEYASERPMISDRTVRACSYHCGLQKPQNCCDIMEVVRTSGAGEGNEVSTMTTSSNRSLESDSPKPASSDEHGFHHGCQVLSLQEPKKKSSCFPRALRLHKKSRSSDASQTVWCTQYQLQNKLVLPLPTDKNSSETSVTANDSRVVHTSSGDENEARENSEALCWKTPMLPFKKAWQSRHQRQNSNLVGWVLPCGTAK